MPTDSKGRTYFRKLFFKKVTSSRENFLLAEGDIALDEDDGKLYRGDGSTLGGILIGQASSIQLTDLSTATTAASGGGGLVYNNTTGQFTFTPAESEAFKTISVSGQSDVVADSSTDTLTVVAGSNMTITTDAGTDTITFASTGGGGGGLSNIVEDTTPQLGGNLDAQAFDITTTGKILFANMYATEGDLPNATTYHGMFAHVHATGAGYFAHGGNWIKLANYTDLSAYQTTGGLGTNIDLHLNQSNPTSGYVLSWNGADYAWVSNAGGGGISNVVEDTTPQLGGNLDMNGNNITFSGTSKAEFGAAQDLSIFHNGNHSIVRETGTGDLYLQSDNNVILSTDTSTKKMVKGVGSGEVILYHNDVQKLNTSTSGVTVVDELHTEGATPHLTLKRTDNANVPTIRFKGSGGTIGASIDFDGTSGTSNELAFQVYDGASIAERFRVTYTGAKVTGNLNIASGVHEKFATLTGATGTVAHDCATAQIFYHTGVAANFTANFTNLTIAQEDATNLAIVINQGGSAYIPNAVQIGGAAQTIIWQGNSAPSGTANGTDSFSFTILNDGGTYVVLGQMVTFGGV